MGDKKWLGSSRWRWMDGNTFLNYINRICNMRSSIELPSVPSGMNATPVPAMSSFALRHCTWRTWHQRSRISELWNFCIGMCVWKSKIKHDLLRLAAFLYVFNCIYVCMFRRTSTCAPRIVASKAVGLSQEKPPWSN